MRRISSLFFQVLKLRLLRLFLILGLVYALGEFLVFVSGLEVALGGGLEYP